MYNYVYIYMYRYESEHIPSYPHLCESGFSSTDGFYDPRQLPKQGTKVQQGLETCR